MISWNRFYDPELGRYISADPIGLAGGMNLYAYVQGNPVNAVDPRGLKDVINLLPDQYKPSGINNLPGQRLPGVTTAVPGLSLLGPAEYFFLTQMGFVNMDEFFSQVYMIEREIECNEKRSGWACFTPPKQVDVMKGDLLVEEKKGTTCWPVTFTGLKNCGCSLY